MGTHAEALARAILGGCAAGLAVYGAIGIGFGRRLGKARRYVPVVLLAVCLGILVVFLWPGR